MAVSRSTGVLVIGWALLALPAWAAEGGKPYADMPNVVIIIGDDLGYGELACYPNHETTPLPTPHIDALAARGVRCLQGYSADPMCWPSRASILTGRYHQRFRSANPPPETERSVAQYLRSAGYATGCFGKWHNTGSIGVWDLQPVNHPSGWGFEEFCGFLGGMHDYFDPRMGTRVVLGGNWPTHMPIYEGTIPVKEVGYLTDWITDRALEFVNRHAERPWPFFLYLSYNAIHTPEQSPPKYLDRNDGDVRRAMLDAMDEGIGRVLSRVEELGQLDNTLVMFVGDNGGARKTSNWELRRGKGFVFEGGIRVPFIVSWPAKLPQGVDYEQPVMHIDLMPTALAAGGVPLPKNLDGKDLVPWLGGKQPGKPHEVLFWGRGDRFAVRQGPWKLVKENDARGAPAQLHLFNLEQDHKEANNLLQQEGERAGELLKIWDAWQAECRREASEAGQAAAQPGG